MLKINKTGFTYLGQDYHLSPQLTKKLHKYPRRLFSQAKAPPCHDPKRYTFYVVTFYQGNNLHTAGVFSSNKNYTKKFTNHTIQHFKIPNLSKPQCKYLKSLETNDFREYIKICKEEIKTSIENP